MTVRFILAAIAIVVVALSSAATAPARPQGPCKDVPFAGVCTPWRDSQSPSPNSRFDLSLPVVKSNTGTGGPQGIG
ncbi:hypothetical protein [Mycolicibacterium sp. GF69]|uniref:hypothetical protein n=1 Tax=Mycolicibacterium sp. GF69 TaxID=2267251 RepID=UPI001057AE7F|nr:hypothetical protein [Mycolicibacterium sp. GF69]